jgi:hypothetical protein
MKPFVLLLLALSLAVPAGAVDVVVFLNGDRLSGEIVATGTRRVRLKTPYGRLEIPRKEIERLVWEDGREEIITPPAGPILDEQAVCAYTDANLDPDDLPGAVVNSFVFAPERVLINPAEGVEAGPPEPGRGGVRLALELPARLVGQRQLVLAYQVNDGTTSSPEWREVVEARASVDLSVGKTVRVTLEQDRGRMEYTDRYMHFVETFRAFAHVAAPSP